MPARTRVSEPAGVRDAALAFGAGIAFFVALAAVVPLRDMTVLVVLWGALAAVALVLVARALGPLYGVPLAIALGFALDAYYIPPTRNFDDRQNWLVVCLYVALGVAIGWLAAGTRRRGEVSEHAREALADEQAALRRVATLVARQPSPEQVFAAVAEEVGTLLAADLSVLARYEPGGAATIVARWGDAGGADGAGAPAWDAVAARVRQTRRPARIDGPRSAVGAPVVLDGTLWGVIVAASSDAAAPPSGTEERMVEFTELVATAISNIEARTALADSRARVIVAADEERRRVVRDLHDGAQQRLVHTVVTLKLARRALGQDPERSAELLGEALQQAQAATDELRELVHGILPSSLTLGGLDAGVRALTTRMSIPVDADVTAERFPETVEATAYFVVAEALTNVARHANARQAAVTAQVDDGLLRIVVRDDGAGGARTDGSGLIGLRDRLAALDGTLDVDSAAGAGTRVTACIPVAPPVASPAAPAAR